MYDPIMEYEVEFLLIFSAVFSAVMLLIGYAIIAKLTKKQ